MGVTVLSTCGHAQSYLVWAVLAEQLLPFAAIAYDDMLMTFASHLPFQTHLIYKRDMVYNVC